MNRKHYNNGDDIGLVFCGCDGCSVSVVNGEVCHERGCPEAWRDYPKACFECGCAVYVDGPARRVYCEDCAVQ